MLLTDEEISLMAHNEDDGDWNDLRFRDTWHAGYKAGARAIEAAILAKLASAELPEPFDKQYDEIDREEFGIYGEGQLIAWGNTRYAQGAAAQLDRLEKAKKALKVAANALSLALSDVDWRKDSPTQPVIHKAYQKAMEASK